MQKVVVTRHPALIQLLRERGLVEDDTEVVSHATPAQVSGQHVFGVLPNSLAVLADRVTEIPLALTPDDRGKELGIERMREIAGEAVTYQVRRV